MLNVITILSRHTPPEWRTQCMASVDEAASRAPFDVSYVLGLWVPGNIGAAYAEALEHCDAEYVCFVDDDDFVEPDAFTCLEKHLASSPTAIHAREIRLYRNGVRLKSDRRHHLSAFRREAIADVPLVKFAAYPNLALHRASRARAVDELSWVYTHRVYRSAGEKLRAKATREEREALKQWA